MRARTRALVAAVFAATTGACATDGPSLVVSTPETLVDEEISISVVDAAPGDTLGLRATTYDQRDRPWTAEATFAVSPTGTVDLDRAAPLPGGSYDGADGMGLFWSALPSVAGAQIAHRAEGVFSTTLELMVDGLVVDSATVVRRFRGPGVSVTVLDENGLLGAYYRPTGEGPFPGVAVFGGSDGGIESAAWRAALLASRGVAALAVPFFGYDGRPADLVEVPLEYGTAALDWLAARDEIGSVGVLGFSKGSEFALSLAARDDRVGTAVAISPSSYVWPGLSDGPPETRSSWSWEGRPLPNVPWAVGPRAGAMFAQGPPFRLRLLYEESLQSADAETLAAAAIPVEDIRGRLLLVSGGDDGSWPASNMAASVSARLVAAGRGVDVQHLDYPEAGHLLFWDFLPVTASDQNQGQVFGGQPAATIRAHRESWSAIRRFLKEGY